jgi:hypothetical protein
MNVLDQKHQEEDASVLKFPKGLYLYFFIIFLLEKTRALPKFY